MALAIVPQSGMWRDFRIVVAITGVCFLLIGGLWLLARDSPSANNSIQFR